jgi:peptide/nickel transport system substrate-binding protein
VAITFKKARADRPRSGARSLAVLAVAGLLLTACGGGDGDSATTGTGGAVADEFSEQGEAVDGGSIDVGLEAETNSWLPGKGSFSGAGTTVAYALYDPLVKRTADGELKPYLAESITANEDLSAWTLALRPGVTFHDGTALDAQTLKTIFDQYLKAPGSNLAATLAEVTSLDVVDDSTVRYTLQGPNAAFPDVLTGAAGWPFSPTAAEKFGEDAGSNPVGTGPFTFVSWQRDSELVVEKNENYWQEGLPHLDSITFRPIPDEDTRLASLQSGDIDALQSLRGSTIARARDLDAVDNYEYLGNQSGAPLINTTKAPFDDVRVRQALAYSIDAEELIAVKDGAGMTRPATQYVSSDSPFFSEKAADAWPAHDPAKAQELYDDYINDPARSDGQPVGTPIAFTYNCTPDPANNEAAQLYQAYWNSLGMQVEIAAVEQATHIQNALNRNYAVQCFRVSSDRDPYYVFRDAFQAGPSNFTGYTDPEIDEQIEVLKTQTDVAARKAAVEAISLKLAEDVPNLFTGSTLADVAVRDAVKHVDGWTFPDGTPGDGVPGAQVMWGHVWLAE